MTTPPDETPPGEERGPADPSGPDSPDLGRLTDHLHGPLGFVAVATAALLAIALLVVARVGRAFLLPIVLAVVLTFLLRPVVRWLARRGVPTVAGAALVMLTLVGTSGFAVYELAGPVADWVERAPRTLSRAEWKLRGVMEEMEKVQEAAEQAEQIADGGGEGESEQQVTVQEQSFGRMVAGRASAALAGGAVMLFLTFFLLASGDKFLRKLARVLPRFGQRRGAVEIAQRIEEEISRYLGTMGLINLVLGCAVAAAMWLLEMPDPVVWGVMAGVLNFVPYIGPLVGIVITGAVAVVEFSATAHILAVPATYMLLNGIEGYLVTPFVMGRRLALNPVALLVGIIFWGWLWGIPGALLAVPLVVILKIVADHVQVLRPFGEFLGA